MTKEKILDRVKKLLALGNSNPSEEEAAQALDRARKLMDEHRLTLAEVKGASDEETCKFDTGDIVTGKVGQRSARAGYNTWENYLTTVVSETTSTRALYSRGYRKSITFAGLEPDVACAVELWNLLRKTIQRQARQFYGPSWTASHRSFAEGFVHALLQRVYVSQLEREKAEREEKEKNASKSTALAVVRKDALATTDRALAQRYGKIPDRKAKSVKSGEMNPEAYFHGEMKGQQQDIETKRRLK